MTIIPFQCQCILFVNRVLDFVIGLGLLIEGRNTPTSDLSTNFVLRPTYLTSEYLFQVQTPSLFNIFAIFMEFSVNFRETLFSTSFGLVDLDHSFPSTIVQSFIHLTLFFKRYLVESKPRSTYIRRLPTIETNLFCFD